MVASYGVRVKGQSKKGVEGLVSESVNLFPEILCTQHQPGIGAMSDFCQHFDVQSFIDQVSPGVLTLLAVHSQIPVKVMQ